MRDFIVTVRRVGNRVESWRVQAVNPNLAAREARVRAKREGKLVQIVGIKQCVPDEAEWRERVEVRALMAGHL